MIVLDAHPPHPDVPLQIADLLRGSLTRRGVAQWWTAANRYLNGAVPAQAWATGPDRVVEAAHAFANGDYL